MAEIVAFLTKGSDCRGKVMKEKDSTIPSFAAFATDWPLISLLKTVFKKLAKSSLGRGESIATAVTTLEK